MISYGGIDAALLLPTKCAVMAAAHSALNICGSAWRSNTQRRFPKAGQLHMLKLRIFYFLEY
jgi:hypothetical protein